MSATGCEWWRSPALTPRATLHPTSSSANQCARGLVADADANGDVLLLLGREWDVAPALTVGQVQAALRALDDSKKPSSSASSDAALLHSIASVFTPSLQRISALLTSIQEHLIELLLARCKEPLVCVPRIAAAYRGTKRKLPAHPFGYVRATLTPLAELLRASDAVDLAALGGREEKEEQQQREVEANDWMEDDLSSSAGSLSTPSSSSLLQTAAGSEMISAVLARLTTDFDSRAQECLADVVRLEELSKKLGKRPTAGAAAAAPSERNDAEKTRAQLDLDAKQYVKLIQEQLAPANAEKMLQPLLQTTQPAHA